MTTHLEPDILEGEVKWASGGIITNKASGGDGIPVELCTPLQYSCLENPVDAGAWKAAVHEVAEGRTRLSDVTFTDFKP